MLYGSVGHFGGLGIQWAVCYGDLDGFVVGVIERSAVVWYMIG